jgi:hypothetical protein
MTLTLTVVVSHRTYPALAPGLPTDASYLVLDMTTIPCHPMIEPADR